MNAIPALRLLACVSLISISCATKVSAQLFHIVATDTFANTTTTDNTGVAINALFEFNYGGTPGLMRLTLTNLSGTARPLSEGGGFYNTGVLTGFGFDAPTGITYVAGSFTETLNNGIPANLLEPSGIDFGPANPMAMPPLATFDFGAEAESPGGVNNNGLSSGFAAIFTFQFTGNLANFNSTGFWANNGSDADLGFRFQTIGGQSGKSEKVDFIINDNPPIPEPSTYGAFAAALLLGVVGVKRRHRAKAVAV
jgi:hypothetical protein